MILEKSNSDSTENEEESSIESLMNLVTKEANEIQIQPSDRDSDGNLLVSPDGPKSKLNEQNWKIVRTKTFKRWFGDWQNPKAGNASKVVDENGEPFCAYHETRNDFLVFEDSKIGTANDDGYYGAGHYFSTNGGIPGFYTGDEQFVMKGFINIKNPYYFSKNEDENLYFRYLLNRKDKEKAIEDATEYLAIDRIKETIEELQRGEIKKHNDIPIGVDFDSYWAKKIETDLAYFQEVLQKREIIIKKLPEIYDLINSIYDGVICSEQGTPLSYSFYSEVVAFTGSQVLITSKE